MRRKRRTGGASTRVSASVAILPDFQFSPWNARIVRALNDFPLARAWRASQ
jgi:hypothetical protein